MRLYWDYVSLKYEIEYVLDKPDQFYMDKTSYTTYLDLMIDRVDIIIGSLKRAAQECSEDPDNCIVPANPNSPSAFRAELPPRYRSACGKQSLPGQISMSVYPLNAQCRGDKEMGGNNPKTRVYSVLDLPPNTDGKLINAYTYVQMKETGGDRTCFETSPAAQRQYINITSAYPGCYLKSKTDIFPQSGEIIGYGGKDNHEFTWYRNSTGILTAARCVSDRKGSDFGRTGCDQITYGPVELTLSHEEDRLPPRA